jgi:hypothetical protein
VSENCLDWFVRHCIQIEPVEDVCCHIGYYRPVFGYVLGHDADSAVLVCSEIYPLGSGFPKDLEDNLIYRSRNDGGNRRPLIS